MNENKYLDLNTYLSNTGDVSIITTLGEKIGKCIELNCGPNRYNGAYYLPKLYLKDIDMQNGIALIQEIIHTPINHRKSGDNYMDMEEYTTFKFSLSNKVKKYKIGINSKYIKIGTRTASKNTKWWKDLPTEPKEVLTYYRYYD